MQYRIVVPAGIDAELHVDIDKNFNKLRVYIRVMYITCTYVVYTWFMLCCIAFCDIVVYCFHIVSCSTLFYSVILYHTIVCYIKLDLITRVILYCVVLCFVGL